MAIILCIDPGAVEPGGLERLLQEMGHGPVRCHRLDQAYHALDAGPVDLILTASRLPDGTPLDLLERLRDRALDVPVIVMAAHGDVDDAAEVMKQGALDYLTLPPRAEAVRLAVGQALQNLRLRRENSDFRRQIEVLRGELAGEVLDLRELERHAIRRALVATSGHRARAAGLLGISERTLRNKLNLSPELVVPARRSRTRV